MKSWSDNNNNSIINNIATGVICLCVCLSLADVTVFYIQTNYICMMTELYMVLQKH